MLGYLHTDSFEICLLNDYVLSRLEFVLEKKICVILSKRFVAGQSDVSHGVFRLPEPSCADDTWRGGGLRAKHSQKRVTQEHRNCQDTLGNTLEHMVGISKHREDGNRGKGDVSPFSRGPCVSFTFFYG